MDKKSINKKFKFLLAGFAIGTFFLMSTIVLWAITGIDIIKSVSVNTFLIFSFIIIPIAVFLLSFFIKIEQGNKSYIGAKIFLWIISIFVLVIFIYYLVIWFLVLLGGDM